jgi:hypothetical protein
MAIKDGDSPLMPDWDSYVEEPLLRRYTSGFRIGQGFAPSVSDADETLTAPIEFEEIVDDSTEEDIRNKG